MAIIRNTAAMRLKGRVGNTSYYTEGGRQIARVSQNASNYGESARRSQAQQQQRAKWGNLVNFYKVSKGWMPLAFENKKENQSDYNKFMSLNLASARIYMPRDYYAVGGCVADEFRVSEGTLRSINVQPVAGSTPQWVTDLALGGDPLSADTTVAEFSAALIANNPHLHYNMQLSFISYQQDVDAWNHPHLICTAYEVTLERDNNESVWSYLPEFCCVNQNGYLGTNDNISRGAFAYILSETVNGSTRVSSQTLIVTEQTLINLYTTDAAKFLAIESYGVDAEVFLMSGSEPQGAAAQPNSLLGIIDLNGNLAPSGTIAGNLEDIADGRGLRIVFNNPVGVITNIVVSTASDSHSFSQAIQISEETAIISFQTLAAAFGSGMTSQLERVNVTMNNKVYTWEAGDD